MSKVILIQGLPGSGKTTVAKMIAEKLQAVHINADWARATVTSHLGFTEGDRQKQARALGSMARMVFEQGPWVVVDFVCPTRTTRAAFFQTFKEPSDVFSVWMNTITEGRFEDTNKLYQKPGEGAYEYVVEGYKTIEELEAHAQNIIDLVTVGHRDYYIRYNTKSDGLRSVWRIIDAQTKEEVLVDDFELRGYMTPGMTVEHDAKKWNVLVRGYAVFIHGPADDYVTFHLNY